MICVAGEKEKQEVCRIFRETLPGRTICRVEQIQNKWLYEKYHVQKLLMEKKTGRKDIEKQLFHGTSQTLPKVFIHIFKY